jgi:hypothetical protein
VRRDEYDALTRRLVDGVAGNERVVGLAAVGSTAARRYEPDEWSDHDFFLVTEPGAQDAFRDDLSWLPEHGRITLSFRETAHGLKVIYDDAHLLEFAVFDLEEVGVASVNRYRVLLDRGGLEERMAEVAARPATPQPDTQLFGLAVASALVADGRARRGETLSGAFFALASARAIAALLARSTPAPDAALLDDLDPLRRFERVYPQTGADLATALRDHPRALLDLLERELRATRPELPWAGLDAVRARL